MTPTAFMVLKGYGIDEKLYKFKSAIVHLTHLLLCFFYVVLCNMQNYKF